MKCSFCGKENQEVKCSGCGANIEKLEFSRSDPYFYNGYICYNLYDWAGDWCEVQFWQGRELVERIRISRLVFEANVKPGEDHMDYFWKLFQVAHKDKIDVSFENDKKYPAMIICIRKEHPEIGRIQSMTFEEVAREYIK